MIIGSVTVSAPGYGYGADSTSASGSSHASSQPTDSRQHTTQSSPSENEQALTDEQKQQVAELSRRDREVRAHEAAHVAAGGSYVRGGASFSFQTGPDGKRYAVGGEVSIDTSGVKDNPSATIRKMQTVRSAALAPASPSGQDRSVAAAASARMAQARQQLNAEKAAETTDSTGEDSGKTPRVSGGYNKKGTAEAIPAEQPAIDIAA